MVGLIVRRGGGGGGLKRMHSSVGRDGHDQGRGARVFACFRGGGAKCLAEHLENVVQLGGGVRLRHIFFLPTNKFLWQNNVDVVGVLATSTYMAELSADKQKKKKHGKKWGMGGGQLPCHPLHPPPPPARRLAWAWLQFFVANFWFKCKLVN